MTILILSLCNCLSLLDCSKNREVKELESHCKIQARAKTKGENDSSRKMSKIDLLVNLPKIAELIWKHQRWRRTEKLDHHCLHVRGHIFFSSNDRTVISLLVDVTCANLSMNTKNVSFRHIWQRYSMGFNHCKQQILTSPPLICLMQVDCSSYKEKVWSLKKINDINRCGFLE